MNRNLFHQRSNGRTRTKTLRRQSRQILQSLRGTASDLVPPAHNEPTTKIVSVDTDSDSFDKLEIVRHLGATTRGLRTLVTVEVLVKSEEPAGCCDDVIDSLSSRETDEDRRGYDGHRGELSDAPLLRFLEAHVGQPWSEVQAKLLRKVGNAPDTRYLVRERVEKRVSTRTMTIDGQVVDCTFPSFDGKLAAPNDLFVHPDTGLLTKLTRAPKVKSETKTKFEQVKLGKLQRLVKVEGVWYVVDFKSIPHIDDLPRDLREEACINASRAEEHAKRLLEDPNDPEPEPYDSRRRPVDILLKEEAVEDPSRVGQYYWNRGQNLSLAPFLREWGAKIYAVRKQQANGDLLRKHGVKND